MLRLEYTSYTLDFRFDARTSRGSMKQRDVWFVRVVSESGITGLGEVAPIDRLSPDVIENVEEKLELVQSKIKRHEAPNSESEAFELARRLGSVEYPSITFGLEMALLDLVNGGRKLIFRDDFSKIDIPINGLVWMGDSDFMREQIMEKLDQGFSCIKLKVGSLDFETEIDILRELRSISNELIIRLDANGAFQTNEVLAKLKKLSRFNIHSIEQPILPMQPEAMEIVCKKSPIPIAFDEELIWIRNEQERLGFLQELRPQYLVLKPTLHGGFASVRNWIDLAEIQGIGWWMTSYLESNIGLNAIAQFASTFNNDEFHGLGTGQLFHNNIVSPIKIVDGHLKYAQSITWGDIDFPQ